MEKVLVSPDGKKIVIVNQNFTYRAQRRLAAWFMPGPYLVEQLLGAGWELLGDL